MEVVGSWYATYLNEKLYFSLIAKMTKLAHIEGLFNVWKVPCVHVMVTLAWRLLLVVMVVWHIPWSQL